MSITIATPVQYRWTDGNVYPGTVLDLTGSSIHHVLFFDASSNTWRVATNPSRDDTQQANNSWAPVNIVATTTVEVTSTATAETSASFDGV